MVAINNIKQEIIAYLESVGVEQNIIKKVLPKLESALWETDDVTKPINADIAKHYRSYLKELPREYHTKFNWVIARHFHQKHYAIILGFVERWEKAQSAFYEAEAEAERKMEEQFESQREAYRDDYEYGDVPGEVKIYNDCILVEAAGFQPGLQEKLPKGGKYQGKGVWKYPLTARKHFETKTGYFWNMPILYGDGVSKYNPEAHKDSGLAIKSSSEDEDLSQALPLSVVGQKVAQRINKIPGYSANTWSKNGQMRIYVKNPKDVGFLIVTPQGIIENKLTHLSQDLEQAIASLNGVIKVSVNDLKKLI